MNKQQMDFDFGAVKDIFRKQYVTSKPKKRGVKILINILVTALIAGIYYYMKYPPINLRAQEFWYFIIFTGIVYAVVAFITARAIKDKSYRPYAIKHSFKVSGIIIGLCALVLLVGALSSAVIFNSKRYASLIEISEGNFTEDVAEISFNEIPMLDRDSAVRLGNAKLGELADMVSQFEVDDTYYSQINYQGKPVRVTPLKYGDFFKWFRNTKEGLPAYMLIDMVTQEVTAIRLDDGIRYSDSELFNRKLMRQAQFQYPTKILHEASFEIDEEGMPYWVIPCIEKKIGLFGGTDINQVILMNAVTGESELYDTGSIPQWIDRSFAADLIVEQYDYYGKYKSGFWNSIFGQKDVTVTTDGYNYIAQNDDVYMYTGITSIGEDTGNIGFILSNQRTKETKFYPVSGAIESVARDSAEGEAQNYKYKSTFPLLLNVSGQPTYFMAMKDDSNLVKGYAMVNVKQYQIVAFSNSTNPQDTKTQYISLLTSKDLAETVEVDETFAEGTITEIRSAVIDGNTVYYIKLDTEDAYYSISASQAHNAVILNVGDRIKISFAKLAEDSAIIPATELEVL